jgi:hypothetical protein
MCCRCQENRHDLWFMVIVGVMVVALLHAVL